MKKSKRIFNKNNMEFIDNALLNTETFNDYLNRFTKIALSMFEWVNLPQTMNSMYLEKCLFYNGQASLLKDEFYGFINTKCSTNGNINIYGLPTSLNCYSYEYSQSRKLYTGLKDIQNEYETCILVQNNWERTPTFSTLQLFAYRLYEAEQTALINIRAQKNPFLLLTDEKQLFAFKQVFEKIDGNAPAIFGDKNNLDPSQIRALNLGAPFIADKIIDYKKEIWNEALTFLRN